MTYRLEFTYHGVLRSLNDYMRDHYKPRNAYFKSVKLNVFTSTIGRRPPVPLTCADIKLTRFHWRFLDWDGAVGSMKPLVDGLVECGVLADDDHKVLERWDVTQMKCKKGESRVEVVVTERVRTAERGESC